MKDLEENIVLSMAMAVRIRLFVRVFSGGTIQIENKEK
jgi:hypothetical protein